MANTIIVLDRSHHILELIKHGIMISLLITTFNWLKWFENQTKVQYFT